MIKEQNITPYVGVGPIALMSRLDDVKAYLKFNKIPHQVEVWSNKGETPKVPWTIVRVEGCVSLFFAKGLLWKVYATRGYEGALPNGIRIGIKTEKALQTDPDLEDDDWNEVYVSKNGYWLEDSLETGEIESISVFIKAVENDDEFYSYEWANGSKIAN